MTTEELKIYQEKRKALIKEYNKKIFKSLLLPILIAVVGVSSTIGIGYGLLSNIPVTAVVALIIFLFAFIMLITRLGANLNNKNKALYKFEEQEGLKRI